MLGEHILAESGGRYSLGERGEKLYGWKNFAELYAVFSAPQILKVLWGVTEIGSIDVTFAQQEKLENLSFVLGARPWRAVAIDFAQGIVRVEPIASSKLARWQGRSGLLGRELCQAMLEIIVSDEAPPEWSRRARDRLTELRAEYRDAGAGSRALVADTYGLRLWTFGGGKANNLLARCLEDRLGEKIVVDNLYVAFRGQAAASEAAIRDAIAELRRDGRPNDGDALRLAESCARGRLSKFQKCLPPRLEAAFLAEVLTDPVAARAAIEPDDDAPS
jgi:ATP-dependent Lhr-like helicase